MDRKKIKSLFLVSDESDNFDVSIKKIKDLISEGNDLTIISLSVLASLELKKRNIKFKTPNLYLNGIESVKLDNIALKFAQSWYKPFENEFTYKDVSLGEMLEYDFYFIFVDVIRSIEIVNKIIESEAPNIIYLPENLKLNEPNFACYETLPNVMKYIVGNERFIKIVKNNIKEKKILIYFNHPLIPSKSLLFNYYKIIINFYQRYRFSFHKHEKNIVLFLDVYASENISKILKNYGCSSIKLYPKKVNNHNENKIQEINNLLRKINFDQLNLEYKDVNLSIVLEDRFKIAITKLKDLILYIDWANEIVNRFPKSIIISMEDVTPIKRAVFRVFTLNNLPSLIIQHGLVTKDMVGFGVMPMEAKKQAVWGKNSYKWHIKRGNKSRSDYWKSKF